MTGEEAGRYVAAIYNTIQSEVPTAPPETVEHLTIAAIETERLG